MAGAFLDSNVLVYAFTDHPRAAAAQTLLQRGCVISAQGLNEFVNVARRKLRMSWRDVHTALGDIQFVCRAVLPIDMETHSDALAVAERYRYSFYDALVIASALRAHCDVLWSEDMQHGQVIKRSLRIANPFPT